MAKRKVVSIQTVGGVLLANLVSFVISSVILNITEINVLNNARLAFQTYHFMGNLCEETNYSNGNMALGGSQDPLFRSKCRRDPLKF